MRTALWQSVKRAFPNLTDKQVDQLLHDEAERERRLVLSGIPLHQTREIVRERRSRASTRIISDPADYHPPRWADGAAAGQHTMDERPEQQRKPDNDKDNALSAKEELEYLLKGVEEISKQARAILFCAHDVLRIRPDRGAFAISAEIDHASDCGERDPRRDSNSELSIARVYRS